MAHHGEQAGGQQLAGPSLCPEPAQLLVGHGFDEQTDGKEQACDLGALPALIELLGWPSKEDGRDKGDEVKMAACGALMAITITTRGKLEAIEGDEQARRVEPRSRAHDEGQRSQNR